MPNHKPVTQRFYEKTHRPNEGDCLIWAAKDRGFVIANGQRVSRRQAAWLLIRKEPLPPFRSLLVTCGNKLCVNPDHFQPASGPAYRPLEGRFWEKVNKDGPVPPLHPELGQCWLWTGSTYEGGYGAIGVGLRKNKGAHRVAWELAHGEILNGLEVCHACDTPGCVRENHLFLGTHKDNMGDCVAKKRFANPIGTLNPRAILSEDDVRYIRLVCAIPGKHRPTYKELAAAFSLKSASTISDIHLRKRWHHVP